MTHRDDLTDHLNRLVHLARSIKMKRALAAVDLNPNLNFWRLIHGSQMDIAVLEWCKIFGSDSETTHWKKIVPLADHNKFRSDLLTSLSTTADEWAGYWAEMKKYRDNLAAHFNRGNRVPNYPKLELALQSSYFYYAYVIKQLRQFGETGFPDDLEAYCLEFESQARRIASVAVAATSTMKELVG